MRYRLAILDTDESYIKALHNYFNITSNNLDVVSFTNFKLFEKYIDNNLIDILLISENMYSREINITNEIVIIILCTHLINKNIISLPRVNKYQNGQVIEESIIKIYEESTSKEIVERIVDNKEIIGIFSPAGGTGKTTISRALGKILSQSHSTLLLSTEEIASYIDMVNNKNKSTFSEMIYYIKGEEINWLMKLKTIKVTDEYGLDYFVPPRCTEDIKELTLNEWVRFIEYLINYSSYERIIIDFTSELSIRNKELMKLCNKILLVLNNSINSLEKNKYMDQSLKLKREKLNENIKIVINYNMNESNQYIEELLRKMKPIYEIPYEKDIMTYHNQILKFNLNNKFGQAIRNMEID